MKILSRGERGGFKELFPISDEMGRGMPGRKQPE
jgi:hypothetical protein